MFGPRSEWSAGSALQAYPGGMNHIGGIYPENAGRLTDQGASHIIIMSHVFRNENTAWKSDNEIVGTVSRDYLAFNKSYRVRDGVFYLRTNGWKRWTEFKIEEENVSGLGELCDEVLIHAFNIEGTRTGIGLNFV